MAYNKQLGTKGTTAFSKDVIPGNIFNAGPYIGIIKNNTDPTRSGRMQVFLIGMGGQEDEPTHWRTVRYASPFFGMTNPVETTASPDTWKKTRHTYGMWFTPPDLNNLVLVSFVQGDPNQGYWFACINPTLSHYMVPGLASSPTNKESLSSTLAASLPGSYYPTAEFNEKNPKNFENWEKFPNINRPVLEPQAEILVEQGLAEDTVRGVISSSSQRETPSHVFGISTPGRDENDLNPEDYSARHRVGGHTFVMDDGDQLGTNQMIRLRSAGGHQIMMNDSEEVLYIANSTGTAWMEFSSDGKISLFSSSDFSVRAKDNINFHADKNINFFAGNDITMLSGKTIHEQTKTHTIKATTELKAYGGKIGIVSGSTLDLQAGSSGSWGANTELVFGANMIYLNDKGPNPVVNPPDVPLTKHQDVVKSGKQWKPSGSASSVVSTLPTHEPWPEHTVVQASSTRVSTGSGGTVVDSEGTPIKSGSAPKKGIDSAAGKGVSRKAAASLLTDQPPASGAIGNMTKDEVTALMTQVGHSESSNNYGAVNQLGYVGKYQFGAAALIDRGYVRKGTTNNGLNDPVNWLNKNGIDSKDSFLSNVDVQESSMFEQLSANYKSLTSKGAITSGSSSSDIAGLLSVAHLLGAGGANQWANGAGGSDANGTTGDTYFNRGRYAVEVLAKSASNSTTA